MKETLDILYQDEHFIAVNKPCGLLVHRSPIDRRERRFALQIIRNQTGQHVFPVHRLDKPTSGILLFALSSEAAKGMSDLFRANQVLKTYIAVVRGYTRENGTIDHGLRALDDRPGAKNSKSDNVFHAVTDYRRISTIELPYAVDKYPTARYSFVELHPRTGRRHQLRRHMKHISHPIIGDTRYGTGVHNRFFRERFNSSRLLLAAVKLEFVHPFTKEAVCIDSEPGGAFQSVVDELFNYK